MRRDSALQGIDVSQWQGRIDFERVKASGIRIVYIKATEGNGFVDPDFEPNYRNAEKAGLAIGFYHYVTARNEKEAREQARFFANHIRDKRQHVRPAMDFEVFEDLSIAAVRDIAEQFLITLEEELDVVPVLYSDASNASDRFADDRFRRYPLWIAEYNVSHPTMENPWRRWSGWQYTDSGRVRGITGTVDKDHFRRDILIRHHTEQCE